MHDPAPTSGDDLELTPEQRSMMARAMAHASWAKTADRSARTAPARKALADRFEREVDPDRVLPEAERAERAASARRAYFARLSLASSKARGARKKNATPDANR